MATVKQYDTVIQHIIAALEQGVAPWRKPWKAPRRGYNPNIHHNAVSGKAYRGMNPWTLESVAITNGYDSKLWLTFNQAKKAGGTVKKGEKATAVYFWKFDQGIKIVPDTKTGEEVEKVRRSVTLRLYYVFNLEQTENVRLPRHRVQPSGQYEGPEEEEETFDVIETAQAIVDGYIGNGGPSLKHDGNDRAYYRPSNDSIHLPEQAQFESPDEYYSTNFHELGHSTGHTSRLDRHSNQLQHSFGSESYSKEELVAEFTSALLCAQSGIDNTLENSAAYIAGWLRKLKSDPRLALVAAGKAQAAADLILKASSVTDTAPVEEEVTQ